jgi:hypothetical protein
MFLESSNSSLKTSLSWPPLFYGKHHSSLDQYLLMNSTRNLKFEEFPHFSDRNITEICNELNFAIAGPF